MTDRPTGTWASVLAALGMAVVAVGCGGGREEASPASAAPAAIPGPGAVGPAPSIIPPTVEVRPVPATRYAPPVTADVQGCMEKALQGGGYDRMSSRDPRKRLVRLQARQACEERLGVARASPAGADGIPIEPDAPAVAGR